MSGSTVRFRGYGFLANDILLQIWLSTLAKHIDEASELTWLTELRESWMDQAPLSLIGTVFAFLEDYVVTNEQRDILLQLARQAHTTLSQQDSIPQAELQTMHVGGIDWDSDLPMSKVLKVGEQFIKLLEGNVAEDQRFFETPPLPPILGNMEPDSD